VDRAPARPGDCRRNSVLTPCTAVSPRATSALDGNTVQVVTDGRLRLSCLLHQQAEPKPDALDVEISVAGYRPLRTSVPLRSGAGNAPTVRFALTPAEGRTLLVLCADGSPYRADIQVYSPTEDALVWSSEGSLDGSHGPLDWFGGPLLVGRAEDARWHAVAASELEGHKLVPVVLDVGTGTIVIDPIPPHGRLLPLVARSVGIRSSAVHSAQQTGPGAARFEHLPAGDYVCGPARWVSAVLTHVHQARLHGARLGAEPDGRAPALPGVVRVEPGSLVRMPWNVRWAAGPGVEGRVTIQGHGGLTPAL
jgi:hypothetical protein